MAARYTLLDRSSRFVVKVRATGVLAAFGHNPTIAFRRFSGWLDFDPAQPRNAAVQISVPADSLEVVDDISTKDRHEIERQMREEVLEARVYPEAHFESREISAERESDHFFQLGIAGDLSLHGMIRRKQIGARLKLRDDEIRLTGTFTLLQSDYRIKRVTALAGALTVKDELSLDFELAGVRERS
jgi:polyisoprenoid-binding protein YceI